jgi:hypothetical protein
MLLALLLAACEIEQRLGRQGGLLAPGHVLHPGFSIVTRAPTRGHYRVRIAGDSGERARSKEKPPCGGFTPPFRRARAQFWKATRTYQNWPPIGYSVPSMLFRSQE